MSLRLRRHWSTRGQAGQRGSQDCTVVEEKGGTEKGGTEKGGTEVGGTEEGGGLGLQGDEHHQAFLGCLKLTPQVAPAAPAKGTVANSNVFV